MKKTVVPPFKGTPTFYKAFLSEVVELKADEAVSAAPRYRFTITTNSVDRDGDVIDPAGWQLDSYLKNPVVLWAHDYRQPPVAVARSIEKSATGLVSEAEFVDAATYPFAGTIASLVKLGALRGTSVGFRPVEGKWSTSPERKGVHFHEQELLEWSIVPVPANPDCLVQARAEGVDVEPLREWAAKTLEQLGAGGAAPPQIVDLAATITAQINSALSGSVARFYSFAASEPLDVSKPYPNEHACRLVDPAGFEKFRRSERTHDGKTYAVIFGLKGDAWSEQAYRYPPDVWDADAAKSHCAAHDGATFEPAKRAEKADADPDDHEDDECPMGEDCPMGLGAEGEEKAKVCSMGAECPMGMGKKKVVKRGRVLSAANEAKLKGAYGAIGEVLAQVAGAPETAAVKAFGGYETSGTTTSASGATSPAHVHDYSVYVASPSMGAPPQFENGYAREIADHSHRITAVSFARGETENSDGHRHGLAPAPGIASAEARVVGKAALPDGTEDLDIDLEAEDLDAIQLTASDVADILREALAPEIGARLAAARAKALGRVD